MAKGSGPFCRIRQLESGRRTRSATTGIRHDPERQISGPHMDKAGWVGARVILGTPFMRGKQKELSLIHI
eukprot:2599911-Alexandrium_andersonii.AAC.1